ncbi:hypothetical protein PRIPAC_92599 [Pristionchus pacificus]|uniref:Uncharacterized protein n=1 Tax=Pristionchus pacificus TaxID=54126 RepID=A0A2A6CEE1_PRIPA|nr:hypothetical protein PRIPAC_92599 [Pristionchus pacificus]|eukprot:PDM76470.1 hypothetical protein PRIPAC_40074 [Pristionchus pacificus]
MRIWLIALLSLPCVINAGDCGCEDVEEQLKRERAEDAKVHGCRTCTKNWGINENACPSVGYECNTAWTFTTNVLHTTDSCTCMEVRCAGTARLAFKGKLVNKMRCNNSEWFVGEEMADPVVCAKPCDTGVCPVSTPKPASADFNPLKVSAANGERNCATAGCEPNNGMTIMNADGTPLVPIADSITEVKCSSEGWKIGENMFQYVMCNASPCGPTKCPVKVAGSAMTSGEVFPLTVTGNGKECATATCPGEYVRMNSDGTVLGPLEAGALTCQEDGTWKDLDSTPRPLVMCKQPSCVNNCDREPPIAQMLPPGTPLNQAVRKDCSFSCPTGQTMFRVLAGYPTTIESAQCALPDGGGYLVSPAQRVTQIGCFMCDLPDGSFDFGAEPTDPKGIVANCVLTCNEGDTLKYRDSSDVDSPWTTVARLYRQLLLTSGLWYDDANDLSLERHTVRCFPKDE